MSAPYNTIKENHLTKQTIKPKTTKCNRNNQLTTAKSNAKTPITKPTTKQHATKTSIRSSIVKPTKQFKQTNQNNTQRIKNSQQHYYTPNKSIILNKHQQKHTNKPQQTINYSIPKVTINKQQSQQNKLKPTNQPKLPN